MTSSIATSSGQWEGAYIWRYRPCTNTMPARGLGRWAHATASSDRAVRESASPPLSRLAREVVSRARPLQPWGSRPQKAPFGPCRADVEGPSQAARKGNRRLVGFCRRPHRLGQADNKANRAEAYREDDARHGMNERGTTPEHPPTACRQGVIEPPHLLDYVGMRAQAQPRVG